MAHGDDYLNEGEKELLKRRGQFHAAETIESLAGIAVLLSRNETREAIRKLDPETARALGNYARMLLLHLPQLPDDQVEEVETENTPLIEETVPTDMSDEFESEQVVVELAVDEPAQIEATEPSAPEEIEPAAVEEPETIEKVSDIHPLGQAWLKEVFGERWNEVLSIPIDSSAQQVASAIIRQYPVKAPVTQFGAITRYVGKLRGLSTKEVSDKGKNGSSATIQMFYMNLSKRVARNSQRDILQAIEQVESPVETVVPAVLDVVEEALPETDEVQQTPPAVAVEETVASKEITLKDIVGRIKSKATLENTQAIALEAHLNPSKKPDVTAARTKMLEAVQSVLATELKNSDYALELRQYELMDTVFAIGGQSFPVSVGEIARNDRLDRSKRVIAQEIYDALGIIFHEVAVVEEKKAAPVEKAPYVFDGEVYMRAALQPETVTEARFAELRKELLRELVRTGQLTSEHAAALFLRMKYSPKGEHKLRSQDLDNLFQDMRKRMADKGGKISEHPGINNIVQKFIESTFPETTIEAMKRGRSTNVTIQQMERLLAAGIHSLYETA